MEQVKIDKRTKEYKMQHVPGKVTTILPGDNPVEAAILPTGQDVPVNKFSMCSRGADCVNASNGQGELLPPNEDGSPKFRRGPELCYDCIWRNDKKPSELKPVVEDSRLDRLEEKMELILEKLNGTQGKEEG